MPTHARRRKQMEDRGYFWEEEQEEKQVQKTLDNWDGEEEEKI